MLFTEAQGPAPRKQAGQSTSLVEEGNVIASERVSVAGGGISKERLAELRELKAHLRALGDVVRLRIVALLAANGEMGVTELVRALRISQPLVSWHLGVLRRTGVVKVRKQGRQVRYSLDHEQLRARQRQLAELVGEER